MSKPSDYAKPENPPDYTAHVPCSSHHGTVRWIEAGVAWDKINDDGNGYVSIQLNVRPVGEWTGSIVLQRIKGRQ